MRQKALWISFRRSSSFFLNATMSTMQADTSVIQKLQSLVSYVNERMALQLEFLPNLFKLFFANKNYIVACCVFKTGVAISYYTRLY